MADVLGVDGKWHPDNQIYGVDGQYHPENENYGVNGKYNHPSLFYRPGTNAKGEHVTYRAASQPYGIEDGRYHEPGSIYCIDGERHPDTSFFGVDGKYHPDGAYYNVMTGEYVDPPPPRR